MQVKVAIASLPTARNFTLQKVHFVIQPKSLCALIGQNGAGKSSLLNCLVKNNPVKRQQIWFDNQDLFKLNVSELGKYIAYVPQENNIYSQTLVRDYVALGRMPHLNWLGWLRKKDHAIINAALHATQTTQLQNRLISTLSGGQKQRVILASALAQDAPIIVLDEPLTGLDLAAQDEIATLLKKLVKEHHKTIIVAIHELDWAVRIADQIAWLHQGTLVACGTPKAVVTAEHIQRYFGVKREVIVDANNNLRIIKP